MKAVFCLFLLTSIGKNVFFNDKLGYNNKIIYKKTLTNTEYYVNLYYIS